MSHEDFRRNAQAWGSTVQHQTRETLSVVADHLAAAADALAAKAAPVGERLSNQLAQDAEQTSQQVDQLRERVAQARERVNDEVVPRVAEFVSSAASSGAVAFQHAGESLQAVAEDADAVVASKTKPKPKRGRRLLLLAVTAAAAGAIAAVLRRRGKSNDPWAAATSGSSQVTSEPSYPANSFGDLPGDAPAVDEGVEVINVNAAEANAAEANSAEGTSDDGGWVAADEQALAEEGMNEAQVAAFEEEFATPNPLNEGVEVADGRQGQ